MVEVSGFQKEPNHRGGLVPEEFVHARIDPRIGFPIEGLLLRLGETDSGQGFALFRLLSAFAIDPSQYVSFFVRT